MQSRLLLEYMRTGAITPLKKGDGKREVESKLGPPDDWKGRIDGIGWVGQVLTDFHDSWAWHYGSLCVTFPDPELDGLLPGISLSYCDILRPIMFPSPFEELPQNYFTRRELVEALRANDVQFNDLRGSNNSDVIMVSEGGVGVGTLGGNWSPKARVTSLFPFEYTCD